MNVSIKDKVDFLRKDILRGAMRKGKGHIASSLSCLDILTVLYYDPFFNNDMVILSKGHGCYGIYAIQADKSGKVGKWEELDLPGCLEGFGSLGHGLPIATGIAFGYTKQNINKHIFCLVGDGEMQEGSNWEALSFIKHHNLTNITVIVDHNGLQAMDKVDNILSGNLFYRLKGWGFSPEECNGHDTQELFNVLMYKPNVVIAYTIKGKGVPCMENVAKYHYRVPKCKEI